jgi:hypothetical protein
MALGIVSASSPKVQATSAAISPDVVTRGRSRRQWKDVRVA